MVQIIRNFIPDFYKKISKKRYNKKSFFSLVGGYIVIEFFLFMISVSENLKHTLDHTSLFIKNVAMIIVGITILVDILGMILFENAKRKKVAVTIAYISGVIFLYFILITLGLLSEYPTKRIIEGIFLFNFLWLLGITLNSCMVYLSLSKGTMIYRDKYANYYINFLSFIAIMLAV
ncbi:hypothetical protein, partial [Enterococcus faecium]|uniref:hypothetical protein n=1 Tax=Enterococcus faecium TaxID=1352 RepID=UPI0023B31F83